MIHDSLSETVIGAAIKVHRALGPGLLESVYEQCLMYELSEIGLCASGQVPISVNYRGLLLEQCFRADIIVENQLLLELKSVEKILQVHKAQVITYLRLAGIPRGLLMNFNCTRLIDGVHRLYHSPVTGEELLIS